MDFIKGGLYKHWKHGDIYKLIEIAYHHETDEEYIIYTSASGKIHLRPKKEWNDIIDIEKNIKRFTFMI